MHEASTHGSGLLKSLTFIQILLAFDGFIHFSRIRIFSLSNVVPYLYVTEAERSNGATRYLPNRHTMHEWRVAITFVISGIISFSSSKFIHCDEMVERAQIKKNNEIHQNESRERREKFWSQKRRMSLFIRFFAEYAARNLHGNGFIYFFAETYMPWPFLSVSLFALSMVHAIIIKWSMSPKSLVY